MDFGRFQSSAYASPVLHDDGVGRNGSRCAFTPTGPAPGRPRRAGREGLVQVEVADVETEIGPAV